MTAPRRTPEEIAREFFGCLAVAHSQSCCSAGYKPGAIADGCNLLAAIIRAALAAAEKERDRFKGMVERAYCVDLSRPPTQEERDFAKTIDPRPSGQGKPVAVEGTPLSLALARAESAEARERALRTALRRLRSEIDCRIQHGAQSGGHLEGILPMLDAALSVKP